MEILLLIAALVAILFFVPSFSSLRERNEERDLTREQTEKDQGHGQRERNDTPAQGKFEAQESDPPQSAQHEVPEVPAMDDFMRPILRWASERPEEFTLREAADAMAVHFNLPPEAREELTGEGNDVGHLYDITSRSINPHLKEAGLVYSVRKEYWKITAIGKKEAFASNEKMDTDYLIHNFPAYRLWKERKKNNEE